MNEDAKKLVEVFTDPDMTGEGRATVLGYARGRLDAQREFGRPAAELPPVEAAEPQNEGKDYVEQAAGA